MGNPENFVHSWVKKYLPWVLSRQDCHQHASHGNGVTSFLVGTSNQGMFQRDNQIIEEHEEYCNKLERAY